MPPVVSLVWGGGRVGGMEVPIRGMGEVGGMWEGFDKVEDE